MFFATFSTDLESTWNSPFLHLFWLPIYLIFFGHISTFCKLLSQTRPKWLKIYIKITYFINMLYESNLAPIKGSGHTRLENGFTLVQGCYALCQRPHGIGAILGRWHFLCDDFAAIDHIKSHATIPWRHFISF